VGPAVVNEMMFDSHESNNHNLPSTKEEVVKTNNPTHAYMKLESKKSKSLDHHGPDWGCFYFGVIFPRVKQANYTVPVFQCARQGS
jgi:hypothetical protein